MLTSSLKSRTLAIVLGAALAAGATVGARPAVAQMPATGAYALSPGAQQMLLFVLAGLPPYEQRLVLNAIQGLGPAGAEAQLYRLSTMSPDLLRGWGQFVVWVLPQLPPPSDQAFVDGLFQVSAPEVQYATQIVNQFAPVLNTIAAETAVTNGQINVFSSDMMELQIDRASQHGEWQRCIQQITLGRRHPGC